MLSLVLFPALATEGYWLPDQLSSIDAELRAAGYTQSGAKLGDLNEGPLAAVVDVDNRCTGAFVSDEGLLVTAYHCIGEAMRHASDPGENLFETGFYAPTRKQERWAGPSFSVSVTEKMEDVTAAVLAGTKKLTGAARSSRIHDNQQTLARRCERPGLTCEVVAFDGGASFRRITKRVYKDVRIVYAPPRSVGYYGGDADNWQWPRHSGDFAFMRVYGDSDFGGGAFAPENTAYKPNHFLPTATTSPAEGDFVMVPGYAAGTYRWKPAVEIDYARDARYPRRIATLADVLDILEGFADTDPAVAAKVSPRILSLNNQMQYAEGNLAAFRRIGSNERKWAFDTELSSWITGSPQRQERYGDVLDQMRRLQAEEASTAPRDHVAKEFLRHSTMFELSHKLYRLAHESKKRNADRAEGFRAKDRLAFADYLDGVDERYDFRVDMEMTRYFLDRLLRLPDSKRIPELDKWFANQPGDTRDEKLTKALDHLFTAGAGLSDATRRRALMDTSLWYLQQSGNPWFELSEALLPFYERLDAAESKRESQWEKVRPVYLEAIQAFIPTRSDTTTFYPDANGTLRVSFGQVRGFSPRDGLIAAPKTRLAGILEKAGPAPYDAPIELVASIERQNWGPYTENGQVPVNFLSTADTTLGNSGSATINAKGQFCGVLFDGNYESMATDWTFEESLTRSIHTDVAYILWYLDAVASADSVLKELGHKPSIEGFTQAAAD